MTQTQWLIVAVLMWCLVLFVANLASESRTSDRFDRIERMIEDVERRQYDMLLPKETE